MRARLAVYGVLAAIALTGVVLWVAGRGPAPPPVAAVTSTPTATRSTPPPTLTATATPIPTATATPTPPPTPPEEPVPAGQTVLFRGGPATGPWQQIGSVAEVTHPDAPRSASFSYREHWSDPEQENMPDWLWDQIVAEVAAQAVELGPPADRVTFDGAPGSEPFNSFGGLETADFDKRLLTAYWSAAYLDGTTAVEAFWPYVLTFDGEIVERGPVWEFREGDFSGVDPLLNAFRARLTAWSTPILAAYRPDGQ